MTRFGGTSLYELLPAIYRIRDAEQAEKYGPLAEQAEKYGPLKDLLDVIGEQAAVLEDNLDQLYDDQFVETCAAWVLPYIADLLGVEGLTATSLGTMSPRAEIAHTIGYRRRKGTAAMLEQLARDVTGWPARAVEFFQLIAATQYMNHLRPENESFISVRRAARLEDLGGPFERNAVFGAPDLTHTVDVRRIARGHGRYNIPNVGLFLWRLKAMSISRAPIVQATAGDARRFFFSPLGADLPLFNRPETETLIAHLAEPVNVPGRILRRPLARNLAAYYGRSLLLEEIDPFDQTKFIRIEPARITVTDLACWRNMPQQDTAVFIDPELGRIAFGKDQSGPIFGTFHYGFSDFMGGGEYSRPDPTAATIVTGSIATALSQLGADGGAVEIADSSRHEETLAIHGAGKRITLRAGNKHRPAIILGGDFFEIDREGDVTLDGLVLADKPVHVTGDVRRLILRHCTLVPGISLNHDGTPAHPGAFSLIVDSETARVEIDRCIVGPIRAPYADVRITDSIVDATDEAMPAYDGGPLTIINSTVIGRVSTPILHLASNCIFLGTVTVQQRQEGCVRFCFVPRGSRTPRRYHCQPTGGSLVRPQFVSTRYRDPGYCQLTASCPPQIRAGADDEASMGAFHDLYEPQRESRLRTSLEEYLRFGLEAGLFYVT